MGYANTGFERSLTVSITKTAGGNVVQGYPKTYNGQNAFPGYLAITDTEMARLSDGDFTTRYNAFVAYVESIESGSDFDTDIVGDGATRFNPSVCLATTTTTTTEAPVVSYPFVVTYANTAAEACTKSSAIAYAEVATPTIGTVLYEDSNLTQAWDLGTFVRFNSPVIAEFGTYVVAVSATATAAYAKGEIMLKTTTDCAATTTSTTTTAPTAPQMAVDFWTADSSSVYNPNISDASMNQMLENDTGLTTTTYSATVSIRNTGSAALTVTNIYEAEDTENLFDLTTSGLPWTINPGFTNGFTIEFNGDLSATPGTYSAVYELESNDPTYEQFAVEVSITVI